MLSVVDHMLPVSLPVISIQPTSAPATPGAATPAHTTASNKNSDFAMHLSILNDNSLETLGALDVHGLDVAVELLLGALLIVTLARDAYTETVWHTLDTRLPDLLVELGVETDVAGTLRK